MLPLLSIKQLACFRRNSDNEVVELCFDNKDPKGFKEFYDIFHSYTQGMHHRKKLSLNFSERHGSSLIGRKELSEFRSSAIYSTKMTEAVSTISVEDVNIH